MFPQGTGWRSTGRIEGSSAWVYFSPGCLQTIFGIVELKPRLLHEEQGLNELISLNGNFWISDKVGDLQVGKRGSNRTAPEVLISRSCHREGHIDLSHTCKSSNPVGFCWADLEWHWCCASSVSPSSRLMGWAIHWEALVISSWLRLSWLLSGPSV